MARFANLGDSSKLLAEPHSMKTGGFWRGLFPPGGRRGASYLERGMGYLASGLAQIAGVESSLSHPDHQGHPHWGEGEVES